MTPSNLRITRRQNFRCVQCGRCCRRWHVALTERDLTILDGLAWKDEGPFLLENLVTRIAGHPYVAHRPNGDCAFLDSESSLCRIHRRFGPEPKPIGCRVYPLNIASSYFGEASVTARMDCPAVQQDLGPPIHRNRAEIADFARQLGLRGGFSTDDLEAISPTAVDLMVRFLLEHIVDKPLASPSRTSLALASAVERLQRLGLGFLNDTATLEDILPSLADKVRTAAAELLAGGLSAVPRAVFREWLAAYLRRDEDAIQKGVSFRLWRTWTLALMLLGRGSPASLGVEHPDIPLDRVGLFRGHKGGLPGDGPAASTPGVASPPSAWECYWRFVAARLETLQFFGVCYYGAPFFTGLRALVLTYPLVLAAARSHAASRGLETPDAEAVQYAVGAIDHSFGRSKLLEMRMWRSVEGFFSGERYRRLLQALGESA